MHISNALLVTAVHVKMNLGENTLNNERPSLVMRKLPLKKQRIDLFTDTAAIMNSFDLRSIVGCPGGISTFRLYFRALFGTFFLKVFLE